MNTWIFQGNPKVFNVNTYIKNHKYIWWSIRQEHFLDKIALGDQVFLWRSDGDKRGTGGILAQARIVSLPQENPNDESPKDYWYTQDRSASYLAVKLEVLEVRFLEGFISRLSLLEHPVLKDLLILRQRTQTNYLLSPQHAIEIRNLWNSNNHSILVRSHSWKVFGGSIAIKELDKSTFLYHGTGIPKEVREFFNAIDMKKGERREVVLQYKQRVYQARLEMDKHPFPRSRLLWKADFSEIIRNQFPQAYSHFLNKGEELLSEVAKFKLEKVGDSSGTYLVEFLSSVDNEILIKDLESEETELYEPRMEGNLISYYGRRYERDPINRKRAIEFHGLSCKVCGFNFEEVYGERGKDFIEVHHIKPLSTLEKEIVVDPEQDLVPVCANCHRMIHRRKDNILTVDELKALVTIR